NMPAEAFYFIKIVDINNAEKDNSDNIVQINALHSVKEIIDFILPKLSATKSEKKLGFFEIIEDENSTL
ncbi:MAG: hypothetical protein MHPSP_000620, partial [Paramarteilia canceri]